MKIEKRRLSALRESDRNARKITPEAVEYVARSIREVGFLSPVVVAPDGEIVCGHVSVRAARKAGLREVPCVVADDLTPEELRAFRLADNKVAALAFWDNEKLADEFKALAGTFSMESMGFDPAMFRPVLPIAGDDVSIRRTSREVDISEVGDDTFEHVCPHCGLKF
jgi:ParB-like chromosome segregation protein Spo0J